MYAFNDLWRFVMKRNITIVQEPNELEHIFDLIRGCESYLEIGTAEGNSMYVLAHALKTNARITYVDLAENHTKPHREKIISDLEAKGYYITPVHGNSHDPEVIMKANGRYEVVLIDAGHRYDDASQDAKNYGPMATKYIIFHDINIPGVREAFDKYKEAHNLSGYTISNSETFGFGILEIK